jgi:hypothetical protein
VRAAIFVFALVSIFCLAGEATAQVTEPAPSPVLAYEGRLLESNVPATGARTFVFSILGPTENELWTSGPQTLTVTSGIYGVVLGGSGMPPLPATLPLQTGLQLQVTADGVQLSPDVALIPALQASSAWSVIGPFLGDISGTQQAISVEKLQGTPLDLAVAPLSGEVLTFNGTSWIASVPTGGSQGPAGPQGSQGAAGPAGAIGSQGPVGPPGPPGSAGVDGNTILSGTTNPTPLTGVDGDFYINTATSTIFGPRIAGNWPTGVPFMGPAGVAGPTGATGPQGATGSTGPQGAQGLQGVAGPLGAPGAPGLNWQGTWSSSTAYALNAAVAYSGSSYVSIQAGTGQEPDTSGSFWTLLSQAGATGAAGPQGPAGTTGATGGAGPQGPSGAVGATGAAGPQGLTGSNGSTGATGPQGPAGAIGHTGPSTVSYTSDGSTINLLQKLTTVSSASQAVDATVSDATGLIGIASSTVATGAGVLVNVYGTASCLFDGATTAGDYVQASPTIAGNCHDVGASYPATNQVLGFVLSSNAAAGTYTVFLFGVEIRASSAAPVSSVFGRTGAVTAAANDYNFNQLAGTLASAQDYSVGSAGTYTKLTTNAQGRVSSGTQAAAGDLSNGTTGSGAITLGTSPTITTPTITTPTITTPTISGALGGNLDLGTGNATVIEVANATITGTALNKLAQLSGAPSTAVIAATSETSGIIGVVVGGAGTTGNAQVATVGVASCTFDNTTTAGDYVQISSSFAGDCHDAGASTPASGQILGLVLSSGAAGTRSMQWFGGQTLGASGSAPVSSVFGRTGAVTAAANDYNFTQLAGSLASAQDYNVGSAGTYTKLTTNAQGRVSSGTQAAAGDLSNGTTGSGAIVLETAPTITTPSLSAPSLGATAQTSTYISNGSTVNLLQTLTTVSSASRAANAATTATGGIVGIAQSTVSAGSSVEVATSGKATCQFDATAVAAGDYVQVSSVSAGDCHDAGSVRPASGQIIGFAIATGSASTAQAVRLFDGEVMALPVPSAAVVATSQSTTSSSYANLATPGPAVTVNISSNGKALVTMTVQSYDEDEDGCNMAFATSGNTTVAASDTQSLDILSYSGAEFQASAIYLVTGLAAGSNTFTAMYKLSPDAVGDGDTCTFLNRNIIVIPY